MKQMRTADLTPAIPQRVDDLRASLVSIVEVCPISVCDSETCPLYAFRLLSHRERIQKFDSLDHEKLIQLAAFHHGYLGYKLCQGSAAKEARAST